MAINRLPSDSTRWQPTLVDQAPRHRGEDELAGEEDDQQPGLRRDVEAKRGGPGRQSKQRARQREDDPEEELTGDGEQEKTEGRDGQSHALDYLPCEARDETSGASGIRAPGVSEARFEVGFFPSRPNGQQDQGRHNPRDEPPAARHQ